MKTPSAHMPMRNRFRGLPVLTLLVAVALVHATVAAASEVVDLRIGSHPEFTRVVFELDTRVCLVNFFPRFAMRFV